MFCSLFCVKVCQHPDLKKLSTCKLYKGGVLFRIGSNNNNFCIQCTLKCHWQKWPQWSANTICTSLRSFLSMTFQCTLNTRLKKIVVVAANSKQYSPLLKLFIFMECMKECRLPPTYAHTCLNHSLLWFHASMRSCQQVLPLKGWLYFKLCWKVKLTINKEENGIFCCFKPCKEAFRIKYYLLNGSCHSPSPP